MCDHELAHDVVESPRPGNGWRTQPKNPPAETNSKPPGRWAIAAMQPPPLVATSGPALPATARLR